MTKPDDIPQDVWEKAYKVIEGYYGFGSESFRVGLREALARAIMAAKAEEREECAQIVEARIELFTRYGSGLTGRNALKEAVNSIREREEEE